MQMILNELSSKFPSKSIEDGRQVMSAFLDTYYAVKTLIDNDEVLLDQDYRSLELAPSYRLEKWRNDPEVDIELRRSFRSLLNRSQIYSSQEFRELGSWNLNADFYHGEMQSNGCLLAYEMDGVAISFLSDDYWKCSVINGTYVNLLEDGSLKSSAAQVRNVSWKGNVLDFQRYYEQQIKDMRMVQIHSGRDIVMHRGTLFPNLIFCDNALNQLKNEISPSETWQVYKKLLELQTLAGGGQTVFRKEHLNHATPESQDTLDRFKQEHTFRLPDESYELFSWHIRFTGSYAGRIFFVPKLENHHIIIGHIGQKLPTVKYH